MMGSEKVPVEVTELPPAILWKEAKLLSIDTETTGFGNDDRIVELGAFFCVGGDLEGGLPRGTLIDPGIPIPERSTAVHGITDARVVGKPMIATIADAFLKWVRDADALVGYNFPFDSRRLEIELGSHWLDAIEGKPVLDALALVRLPNVGKYWPGKKAGNPGRHKLENVRKRFNLYGPKRGQDHRASSDAEGAMRVLFRFADRLDPDLEKASAFLAKTAAEHEAEFEQFKRNNPLPEEQGAAQ